MQSDNVYILDIPKARSSLISRLEFDEDRNLLAVSIRYKDKPVVYENVTWSVYECMMQSESIGKYYLHYIKPNFKQTKNFTMSDEKRKIPTKNKASDQVRWIDLSINVREIIKAWIIAGETGDWLAMKLRMLPDGQVDKYGNLGMITQAVPSSLYKEAEAKEKGSGKKLQGPILGNAAELDWGNTGGNTEGLPGQQQGNLMGDNADDTLPF